MKITVNVDSILVKSEITLTEAREILLDKGCTILAFDLFVEGIVLHILAGTVGNRADSAFIALSKINVPISYCDETPFFETRSAALKVANFISESEFKALKPLSCEFS